MLLASCAGGTTSSTNNTTSEEPTTSDTPTSPDVSSNEPTTSDEPTTSEEPTSSEVVEDTESDLNLKFGGNDEYTIVNNADNTEADVSYTSIKSLTYHNITANLGYTFDGVTKFGLSFENTGTTTINIRMDVISSAYSSDKGGHAINSAASATGDLVYGKTDTEWGGSFFTLEGGKKGACKVEVLSGYAPESVLLMLDSFGGSDTDLRTGSVKINGYKAYNGTVTPVKEAETKEVNIGHWSLNSSKFNRTESAEYTQLTYTGLPKNGYRYAGIVDSGKFGDVDAYPYVTLTLKNNSDHDSLFRVDLNAKKDDKAYLNASSTSSTGQETTTDLVYGGSSITVASGAVAKITINYTGSLGFIGVMVDNQYPGDETTINGDISLGNVLLFSKE